MLEAGGRDEGSLACLAGAQVPVDAFNAISMLFCLAVPGSRKRAEVETVLLD